MASIYRDFVLVAENHFLRMVHITAAAVALCSVLVVPVLKEAAMRPFSPRFNAASTLEDDLVSN